MSTRFEFDVFLSHKTEDKPAVEIIARQLRVVYGLKPFLDIWNLVPGSAWLSDLEQALNLSATTAVFLGPGGTGPWHHQELQRALVNAVKSHEEYRVIPVLLPGADESRLGGFLGLRGWVDFRAGIDDEEAMARLVGGIKGEVVETRGFELPDEPAPYCGLNRFEQENAGFFFGRTKEIERLVKRVAASPFVAVVGASGGGKSSLVRAGLLPALTNGAIPGAESWRVVTFQPGREPLRALANQMVLTLPRVERPEAADRLVERLSGAGARLLDTLTSWYAESPAPLLLFVDQLEELFTQAVETPGSQGPPKRPAEILIRGISDLVRRGAGQVRVVITLRADFLARCLPFPELRDLLQDNQLLLGELGDEALREVVVLPAQKVGAFFEAGLVSLILRDVAGERGSLPMLQQALLQLWKARRGPWLTRSAYEESGGVAGALQRFAQRVYDGLPPGEQEITRKIFIRLTNLGDGVGDTRRRVPRGELYPAGVDSGLVDRVIAKLSGNDARLIVAGDEGVEVAHESLLQRWDTLRQWLDENRDDLRLHQRISEAAMLWQSAGNSSDDLYTGARLELVDQWERSHPQTLTELEAAFLSASRARRDAERERQERIRREEEARQRHELEMAKELAEKERQRADEQQRYAEEQRQAAEKMQRLALISVSERLHVDLQELLNRIDRNVGRIVELRGRWYSPSNLFWGGHQYSEATLERMVEIKSALDDYLVKLEGSRRSWERNEVLRTTDAKDAFAETWRSVVFVQVKLIERFVSHVFVAGFDDARDLERWNVLFQDVFKITKRAQTRISNELIDSVS